MNVIFIDFDGVLFTFRHDNDELLEKRIKILSDICHMYDAKVVIESSEKELIDEDTLETESSWVQHVFDLFKKHDVECIGRTPEVKRYLTPEKNAFLPIWKEDEIRLYLFRHPEIEHYCVLDDDDLTYMRRKSDLDKVRNHLIVVQNDWKMQPEEEGLLPKHIEEVGEKLKEENEVRRLVLKYKNKH